MKQLVDYLLLCILVLCFWAILAIGLSIIPLIPMDISDPVAQNWNGVALNLSYSFIAGCIFYVFTVKLPNLITKNKISPVLQIKRRNIERIIRDLLFEFAKDSEYSAADGVRNDSICEKILKSKDWNEYIPSYMQYSGTQVPYWVLFKVYGNSLQNEIRSYITAYSSYMSVEEICTLEQILDVSFWRNILTLSNLNPLHIEVPNGRDSLINGFLEVTRLMAKLQYRS